MARIDGDTLRKTVDGERHYLQRPHGLAFDLSILQEAEKAGCVLAVVYDKAIGATYRAALADFAVHGVKLDRGFGLQVCLPLAFWRCERRGEPRQLAFAGLGA